MTKKKAQELTLNLQVIERRPDNGCARCCWWMQLGKQPWGRCSLLRERRWFQAPPCCEYERDPDVKDYISYIP